MSKEDFIEAVKCGIVALVRELKNTIKDYQTRALAVEEACENGHLNVLHALQDYPLSPMCLKPRAYELCSMAFEHKVP